MPSLSTTYLLPALLLNPAFVLHLINTTVSYFVTPFQAISPSLHPFMDSIGPKRDTALYMDMHADDALCWRYTAVMVVVQLLAFGQVQDNRVRRKERREKKVAERVEREKIRKEKAERERTEKMETKTNGHATRCDGTADVLAWDEKALGNGSVEVNEITLTGNGNGNPMCKIEMDNDSGGETDLTETSEEEMIV